MFQFECEHGDVLEKNLKTIEIIVFQPLFPAGYKLMKALGVDDLTKRISPRLDKFHSVDPTGTQKGVTYWRKTLLYQGKLTLNTIRYTVVFTF